MEFGKEWRERGGGGWTSKLGRDLHGCDFWSSIRMGWGAFSQYTRFEVGVGSCVRFWHDCCCVQPLKMAFLVLYEISTDREVTLEFSLVGQGVEESSWDLRFIWDLNDWELGPVVVFLHILGSSSPSTENGERVRWKSKKNMGFDIHLHYNALRGSFFVIFPWKGIWELRHPGKFLYLFGLQHGERYSVII